MTDECWLADRNVRVAIDPATLVIRRATLKDTWFLFRLRNDPETRAAFLHTEPVEIQTHERWMKAALAREDVRLFIVHETTSPANQPVATFRLDDEADGVHVSITVAPEYRGTGLAAPIIAKLRQLEIVKPLIADIKPDNVKSQRAFQRAGFQEHTRRYIWPGERVSI